MNLDIIDVEHLGKPHVIASCLVRTPSHAVLIDPGPGSTLPTLLTKLDALGVTPSGLSAVLLTHIHLDHAGATGALAALNPALRVYVHHRGAPHLIAPERLLKSATRLYGDQMATLWGDFLAVPAQQVHPLHGGEHIDLGTEALEVIEALGHASHHVAYFHAPSATAFTGDAAGVRIAGTAYVTAPTPPPDIDVPRWLDTLDRIAAWAPKRLIITHFGAVTDVAWHIAELKAALQRWSDWVRASLDKPGDDASHTAAFVAWVREQAAALLEPEVVASLLQAAPPDTCWLGLARYWRQVRAGDAQG